jgi:CRP-like cAMP-binding protein
VWRPASRRPYPAGAPGSSPFTGSSPPAVDAILGVVNEEDLRRLKEAGSALAFSAGQMLVERGKPGTGVYVVVDGTLVVEAPEGTRELGPGAVLGERALLSDDGLRTARVRAVTDGVAVTVERAEVDRLCAEDPAFAERLSGLY